MPTENSLSKGRNILLHVCCAPCSCTIILTLMEEGLVPVLFFCNPNIFPREEYGHRKASVTRFAEKHGLTVIDRDPGHEHWLEHVRGLEQEPERGRRCCACFDMRLDQAARYAHNNKFRTFATTLGISRFKDMSQVDQSGQTAAARYPGLTYLARNWRAHDALTRSLMIARAEHFYKQDYCGCEFSLNEANERRQKNGRPAIVHGKVFWF